MKMSLCTAINAPPHSCSPSTLRPLIPGKTRAARAAGAAITGWGDSDRKSKFRTADGCEVERKWKKAEYEEKVKCKPGRYGYGY